MARSNEPMIWSLFAAGGMVAAMLMPVTVVLTSFAVAWGCVSEQGLLDAIRHPLGRLYLLLLITLPLFHAAHRLRHTVMDLGARGYSRSLGVLFYGGAIVCTALAVHVLWTMP